MATASASSSSFASESECKSDATPLPFEDRVRFVFIRHGVAQNNVDSKYWWVPNTQLTDEGRKLLVGKRAELHSHPHYTDIQQIYSSPLHRALETALIMFSAHKFEEEGRESDGLHELIQVTPAVSELWSCECDEGSPKSTFLKEYPEYSEWKGWEAISERWWDTSGRKSMARVPITKEWLISEADKLKKQGDSGMDSVIAVVAHSNFYRELLSLEVANGAAVWMSLREFQSIKKKSLSWE